MLNPFERVALALSYMKGAKVDDWVSQQWDKISTKVQGDQGANPPIPPKRLDTDEQLWTDFVSDFERTFVDTASAEQAYAELTKLEMKVDEVDEYITKFEHLMTKAGWERSTRGSLEMFKQGLRKDSHLTILQRDPIAGTLDEWQQAARREVQRQKLIVASLGPPGGEFLSTRSNRRRELLGNPTNRQLQRGPDAMRTGVLAVRLSESERKKRQIEGHCFFWNKQGHFCKDCPSRKEDGGNGRSQRRTEQPEW